MWATIFSWLFTSQGAKATGAVVGGSSLTVLIMVGLVDASEKRSKEHAEILVTSESKQNAIRFQYISEDLGELKDDTKIIKHELKKLNDKEK